MHRHLRRIYLLVAVPSSAGTSSAPAYVILKWRKYSCPVRFWRAVIGQPQIGAARDHRWSDEAREPASFDAFLREAYVKHAILSVLLIDIDQFKGAWATRPGTVASSALPR